MRFHKDGTLPPQTHWVWVFGSNLAGIHGGGAARVAKDIYNRPYGTETAEGLYTSYNLQESYAIPTKDRRLQSLQLDQIQHHVEIFRKHVEENPSKIYFVTRIGCVLAGYENEDIAPMFKGFPHNCSFADEWMPFIWEEDNNIQSGTIFALNPIWLDK